MVFESGVSTGVYNISMVLFIHESPEAGVFGCLVWLVQVLCYEVGMVVVVGVIVSVLKVLPRETNCGIICL